jgi:PBSX family phage terminase large subunit
VRISEFSPKQGEVLKFIFAPEEVLVADGSVRSGKTMSMIVAYLIWAMEHFDRTNFIIAGKTVTSTERNIIRPLQDVEGLPYRLHYKRADRILVATCGGKENYFYVFGGKDEGSYQLIQGLTAAGAFFDEVALQPQSFVDQATARTLTFADAKLWFNCNPESPNHWFYQMYLKTPRPEVKYLHFLMDDNPIMGEVEIEKAKRMYSGVFYQRYVLGQWVRAEGVIFRQFADDSEGWLIDDNLDYDTIKQIAYITFGVDFGESTSHTVFVATGILRRGAGIIALDERKLNSKGISPDKIEREFIDFVQQVHKEFPDIRLSYAFCDHPETIINGLNIALRKANIPISAVMAAKEKINTRIYAQEKMLNLGLLKIRRKCTKLVFSLQNQTWDEKHTDQRLDENPDINDIADAFEYSWEAWIDDIGVRL